MGLRLGRNVQKNQGKTDDRKERGNVEKTPK